MKKVLIIALFVIGIMSKAIADQGENNFFHLLSKKIHFPVNQQIVENKLAVKIHISISEDGKELFVNAETENTALKNALESQVEAMSSNISVDMHGQNYVFKLVIEKE